MIAIDFEKLCNNMKKLCHFLCSFHKRGRNFYKIYLLEYKQIQKQYKFVRNKTNRKRNVQEK